jgi:hypothetical protein
MARPAAVRGRGRRFRGTHLTIRGYPDGVVADGEPGGPERLREARMPDAPPLAEAPAWWWAGTDWDALQDPGPPETSPRAQHALLLGIASLGLFGLVLGPLAVYVGYRAKQEIEKGAFDGDSQATAGMVLGMAGFVVMASLLVRLLVPKLPDVEWVAALVP